MSTPGKKRRHSGADSSAGTAATAAASAPASKVRKTQATSAPSSSAAAATSSSSSRSRPTGVDVFIQCGLATEADWTVQILCGQRDVSHIKKAAFDGPEVSYRYHVVPLQVRDKKEAPHEILIGVGWQPAMGPQATSNYCAAVLPQLKQWRVQLWAMSGILAGVEGQCQLGDVVAALDATHLGGKIDAAQNLLSQASFSEIRSQTAHLVHDLVNPSQSVRWKKHFLDFIIRDDDGNRVCFTTPVAASSASAAAASSSSGFANRPSNPLPPPMRWCVLDVLHWLDTHKEDTEGLVDYLDGAPYSQFRASVLGKAEKAKYYETKDGRLQLTSDGAAFLHKARSQANYSILKKFPVKYQSSPVAVAGTVFSSEFVREDLDASTGTLKKIKEQSAQRKIVGVDMEISAFYKAVKDSSIPFLAVKGACDLGDAWKDDNFHAAAAEGSAAFLKAFILEGYEHGQFRLVSNQSQLRTSLPDVQASASSASAGGTHFKITSAFGPIHAGNTYNGPVTHNHARPRKQSEAEKAAMRRSAGPLSAAEQQEGYDRGDYNFQPNRTESFPEEIQPDFDALRRDPYLRSIGHLFDPPGYAAPLYFHDGMLKGLNAQGEFKDLLRQFLKQNSDGDFFMFSGDFQGKLEEKHRKRMRRYYVFPTGNVKTDKLRRDATGC